MMIKNQRLSFGRSIVDLMVVSLPVTDLREKQMSGVNPLNGGHTQTFIYVVK